MGYGKNELVGEWSKEKLKYLQAYLPAYTNATQKARQKFYIDGFAGKGDWLKSLVVKLRKNKN
ncbi:hypothetical protein [Candidatus Contubernalis alkaliaceticus]|uniref:hypothetical protein n=1 Tax=Candidatus Contubernalis alkaliaceticus TaxID=338645 RepID=UPI001F4C27A6|nr:hypothetical protein [Candidatus Contubernalis alkalaceticus]UNC91644.1 hypothetical protein HUE98_05790 [Candidatus Contubernalis alkalaceticus]